MITGKKAFQIWAQDNKNFRCYKKRPKILVKKSIFLKNQAFPSTIVPLLS